VILRSITCAREGVNNRSATIHILRETMPNVSLLVKQLKKERDRAERQLSGLNAALTAFANVYGGGKPTRKRRKMSGKSRAKIAAAQRARWARFRAKRKS
jgi:hypothetical protein